MHMPNEETTSTSELERRIVQSWPARDWSETHVVLAVSGGADSVALLRAMVALKELHGGRGRIFVAHVNHGLREQAADDAEWLRGLCERLSVELEIATVDVAAIAAAKGDGWEAAARLARYEALQGIAERRGARFVATAHTADDQVETILHRVLRGTGIEGLAGMMRVRPLSASIALVRPMLNVSRREVIEYLAAMGQEYRTDATNQDTRWTRNRLRNELLPILREQYNAAVDGALTRLAVQAAEVQQVMAELAAGMARECMAVNGGVVRIDRNQLKPQSLAIVREVLKYAWRQQGWSEQSMGFHEWQTLAATAFSQSAQPFCLPGGIQISCAGQFIELRLLAGRRDIT